MKSCAEVPARALSKVITTAPASPVPASNRNLLVSVVRRNCGLLGLKKLRGCGSKVTAKAGLPCARPIRSAAPITARWPRWTPSKLPIATTAPLGIAEAGVWSRMTVKSLVISTVSQIVVGEGQNDARRTVAWPSHISQAAAFAYLSLQDLAARPQVG